MRTRRRDKAEEHRERIARIVIDILSRSGLEAVTVREVARCAGYSTTVVTHYFENKNALLFYTYRKVSDESYARVNAALGQDDTDLLRLVSALAYTDHPEYWRVYFAFWQCALVDEDFLAEQDRRTKDVQRIMTDLLVRRGLGGGDPGLVASEIVLTVQGLGLQSILHPAEWSEDRKNDVINRLVDRVCSGR